MRVRQWHQLEIPFDADELTHPHVPAPVVRTHGSGDIAVDDRCVTCGWPVDAESVSMCDVEKCPLVPISATGESTGDSQ